MSLQGVPIEKVERFVYLGQVIQLSRNHTSEISKGISSAWNSYRKVGALLTHRLTDMSLKRKVFHMCILPILLYGCEAWCLTKEAQSKLMRCQRSMERRMLGICLRDHVRHEDIRARTGLKDVCKEAKKRKWKYMEKMQLRREEGRWDQRLMDWTPPYKRPLGRPRLRWTDDFRKHHGLRWRDLTLTRQWNPD
ncbi:unnamed protein product [Bursaphelenchus xylophilus]|uniref:(pine wood nematode) hypothetical protein n=1 Tax=Bursaphelenchus xylophilus TaxID=6326 RepID=A0A1I7SDI1_BURXY|nr:unnamed protein product [Bursaphelenchus xylophilus]CAG9131653.1 unnamed protein product [Bursaphelenchus xylophilus]